MVVSLKSNRKMNQKGTRRANSRRPNFSSAEIEAIVSFMEARKDLEYGELGGRYAVSADVRMAYDELTELVNSVNGCLKIKRTASEVKDKWMCFKYRTKKKAQAIMAKRATEGSRATSAASCPWETLNPLEERVVELIGRDVVYAINPDSPNTEAVKGHGSANRRGGRQNSQSSGSQLPNGQTKIKIEPTFDSPSTERPHSNFRIDPVPSPPIQCPPPTTNGLLRMLMDQHQLMLESLTNFQESLDTHNKIQRGIMCMKYMKLKLLADERNVEVVLPSELESLLADTNDV